MEPVSLTVGIVPLYNVALEVLDRVRDYRDFGEESQTLFLHFDASKLKLQNWAETLGLRGHGGNLADPHDPRLDDPRTASVIQNLLRASATIFDKVEYRSASLKLPLRQRSADTSGWSLPTDYNSNKFKQYQHFSTKSRIAWATGGKAKFEKDVRSFEGLVDILNALVPPPDPHAETMVKLSHINEKLDLLADLDIGLEKLLETATAQRYTDIDTWLDAIKDEDQYGRFITLRLDGTCNWILGLPAYTRWESQDSENGEVQDSENGKAKILWISAPAGFGKSVLSASVIQHLRKNLEIPVAYCFSSSHAQNIRDLDGIARTWITQLIRSNKDILDLTYETFRKQNNRRALRDDVWNLLREIAMQDLACILVLDGLDEFQDIDERRQFLRLLKEALQATNSRALITSRYEFDIESELYASAMGPRNYEIIEFRITPENVQEDITLLSQDIVVKRLPKQEHSLRQELAMKMAERCDGQFLWLKFQQDRLRDSKSAKALRDIVQAMPQQLQFVYERSWNSIESLDEVDREHAVDILRWSSFAYRPLIIQELAEALIVNLDIGMIAFSEDDLPRAIDDDYIDGEIKTLCGPLIELQEDRERNSTAVGLIHASVYEFLVKKLPTPAIVGVLPNTSLSVEAQHAYLAACCVRILDFPAAWISKDGNYRPLASYAADSWFRHLQDSKGCYSSVSDLVNNFMKPDNEHFDKWRSHYENIPGTSFYYACLFGMVPAMDFLHSVEAVNINSFGGYFGTPLQAICVKGHTEAFNRLLLWQADVSVRGGHFNTALNAAAFHGRTHMVEALLDLGTPTLPAGPESFEAVDLAAGQGHTKVVRLLLKRGINISSMESLPPFVRPYGELTFSATPVFAATANGHFEVVKLLLEQGANPNTCNQDRDTALHLAVTRNFYEIVKLLIQHGAMLDLLGKGGAPLHLAASHGYLNMVALLIEHRAVVDILRHSRWTPLHEAARSGHTSVVSLLVENDANPDKRTTSGLTPLYLAARYGWFHTAELLVEKEADINIKSTQGWTLLHSAIHNEHVDIAEFLIQRNAVLKATDDGWTPLHLAAEPALFTITRQLLQRGADVNARIDDGSTALFLCIQTRDEVDEERRLAVVKLLLEHGADFSSDTDGWTPLHLAAARVLFTVTLQLLQRGADVNARADDGSTALLLCIQAGDEVDEKRCLAVFKLLLEHGAEVSADTRGWTALHAAAQFDYTEIINFLLDQGVDVNVQDNRRHTALQIAIINDSLESAKLLLRSGAKVMDRDKFGTTALHRAVVRERLEFAKSIVERDDCDVNAATDLGATPLRNAIERGTDEMIEYLISSGARLDALDLYGMRCSDWLKRLRPDFLLPTRMLSIPDIPDNPSGPDMVILRRTLVSLARILRTSTEEYVRGFYCLARGFFLLGMEDDAQIAYQQWLLWGIRSEKLPLCDNCWRTPNRRDPFYGCKICPDSDLCADCMTKHQREPVLQICRDHDFLKIVAPEAKSRPSDTDALNRWLDGIVERFQDTDAEMMSSNLHVVAER